MRSSGLLLALAMILVPPAPQTTERTKPSFDVASIKVSLPGTRQQIAIEPGGRFVANGVQLNLLVALAYHLQAYQLSGADRWMATDQWSIEAKADDISAIPAWAPPNVPDVIAVRLQSLLENRFALKMHWEAAQRQIYALTVGKNGPKLVAVEAPPSTKPDQSAPSSRPPVQPDGTLPPNFAPPPGATLAGPGRIFASAITMNQLITLLNRLMDQPVVDRTGLAGYFNVDLHFDPASAPRSFGPPRPDSSSPPSPDPSIYTALQEQLGLKLESRKEPVEMLVVDSAQKPSEN